MIDAGSLGGFDAHVVEDLGARAAGAGFAHLPEIVLQAVLEDALLGDAGLDPELLGFVVARHAVCAFEDGDVEPVFGDAEPLRAGDQFPGERDGIALEVVAEAEVAQHLEEGVVAAREADVFKVVVLAAGADALLRSGGARVVALLRAKEKVLELVHAGVGEQQRGIVGRHQRRRVHAAVPLRLKKAQKQLANFVSRSELHDSFSVIGNNAGADMHPASRC